MAAPVLYCRGCNEEFTATDDDPRCPQCRQQMTACDEAPTLDLAETAAGTIEDNRPISTDISRHLVGRQFASYTIESFLGKGGMAWVFLARHNTLHRPCAIKVLSPELRSRDDSFLDMFIAEARAAASVIHPHIVTVHNIGQANSFHFIELEYVPGESLQHVVKREEKFDSSRATRFLVQACSALAEAHRHDLIHRDFKPSNILVGSRDFAKLADFGLAKRISSDQSEDSDESLTGTPYFMAPELFRRVPATRQSDMYAVGISYFYLLTGQFPFVDRKVMRLAAKHAAAPIPDPRVQCPELPEGVVDLVNRCMAKNPADRPADGQELQEELQVISRRLRDVKSLVVEAVSEMDASWESDGDRVTIDVRLPNERSQRVYVEETDCCPWSEQLLKIYSRCCPVDESYYRRALELNANICHGSLSIEKLEGQPFFVMGNTYPRSTCDPEEIRHSVQDVANWADRVELALTGQDQN
ncbi:MAG: protein kinase [Planctomycetes bacterium]|nr:protein kinase [Planctomycetota bacterium]MBL7038652.1 protein kinase [Pirellulaceae bacterium]